MKNTKIRTCIVCGKQYEYCPHCGEYNPYQMWRMIYCSENDKEIYHIFDEYKAKHLTVQEAYEKLSKLDLSNKANFTELVKADINEILEKGKPVTTINKNKSKKFSEVEKEKDKKIVKND